ncbi:hypothetical protein [Risungbinella massiliensis]|uniref:hypothetical protein n=1 Tax=Risungbinella massiliensis TaxID=1329796 RepID=UPI0005CC3F4B|nr:hypothetical protein [Risungbinella massiliensis]
MQTKAIGFALVIAGALLLVVQARIAEVKSLISWPFLLFLLGVVLVFVSFLQKQSQLTLIGGIFASIGLFIWGINYVKNWDSHWSVLVGMIGLVLLLQFMLNHNNMTLAVGLLLLCIGFFAWPGIRQIEFLAPVANILNSYWPVCVVGIGIVFLFKKN